MSIPIPRLKSTRLVSALLMTMSFVASPVVAQSEQDIVIIGNTTDQNQNFQSYWQQLLNLNQAATSSRLQQQPQPQAVDPEENRDSILRNLYVQDLGLDSIIQLNGSSQLSGLLTNENDIPVTILAVNYEILDRSGELLQTGSAQPEPNTIAPGQAVTFSDTLWTISPDAGYEVRLLDPALEIDPNFQ